MVTFKSAGLLAAAILFLPPFLWAEEDSKKTSGVNSRENIEEVLVQAQKDSIENELAAAEKIPGGVTVIDTEKLRQRNLGSLADMLRYVPGLWAASGSTGDSTFLSSRGSNLDATNYDGNGIKLLQDGLPVTAADGNNHNRDVDPLSANYAIVARGANALTYGASTLGGAINFLTPTARDTRPQVSLSGGSDSLQQGRVTTGIVSGNFDGLVTAETRRWDGYRDHHEQDRVGLYSNAGWQFSNTVRSRLYLTYIDNDQELPGSLTRAEWKDDPTQAQAAAVTGNYQYNVKTWRAANKTDWDINENSSLSIGFSIEEQNLYHPIVYSPFFSLLIDTEQRNAGASLRYNLRLGNHDLLAGLDYGKTTVEGGNYSHEGGVRRNLMTDVDNNADSLELFLVDNWQLTENWTAVLGVQVVNGSREVSNISVPSGSQYNPRGDYDSVNPRLGLIYKLSPDVELFANLSKLYEAPTLYELEDDACACGDTLDAMHGTVFELGTRGSKPLATDGQWYWEVSAYYGQLKDEILSKDDPGAPGTSLSANVDDTIHAGIEALFGASITLGSESHRLEPQISVTLNDFSFDDDTVYGNNELPAAPGYAIKGEIMYRGANGFFIGPTFDIVDERYADFSNTYTVDAYELLGLRAGLARENWELWGEVRNITDKDYISQFSVKDVAAADAAILTPGEPRSVYVGVRIQF
jgi:iron complex outermembrane receptor protein